MLNTVTLSTGKVFEIAPLSVGQAELLLSAHNALGPIRSTQDKMNSGFARSTACHHSIQNAGSTVSLEEFESEMTFEEVDELFASVASQLDAYLSLPAFTNVRCRRHRSRSNESLCS